MNPPTVQALGTVPYTPTFEAMQRFTNDRTSETPDEIWVLQHEAVYTLGQAGDPNHVLDAGVIPVVQSDRGGQVTYHGPGQLIVYPLIDLRRYGLGVRSMVEMLENVVIMMLESYGIDAQARRDAPGVYVNSAKIAALGLRIRRGCSFHGISVNIDMNLEPFSRINPCGYQGLQITQLADHVTDVRTQDVSDRVVQLLIGELSDKDELNNRITS